MNQSASHIRAQVSYRPADTVADREFGQMLHHSAYRDVVVKQFGEWDEYRQNQFFIEGWNRAPHQIIQFDSRDVGIVSSAQHSDHLFLSELQILPEFQSRGIGTMVIHEHMERSRRMGVPLRLQVLKENRAKDLYLRQGFTITTTTATHVIMEWTGKQVAA